MLKRKVLNNLFAAGLIIMFIVLSGCGQSGQETAKAGSGTAGQISSEPMTLTVYQHSANISDEEFQRLISEPVQKKYPNISMQLIHTSPDNKPETLVSNGSLPDIVFGSQASVSNFNDLGAVIDLTELAKQNKLDLSKFDPAAMNTIQIRGSAGQTLALPFSINFSALYYNKDIFDKFAVAYPKDGMTWEDAAQLARKLTQNVGGIQYEGFGLDGGLSRIGQELSLPAIDPKTNKATLATDGWKRVYEVLKMFYDIPGFDGKSKAKDMFLKDQRVAMIASQGARVGEIEEMFNQGKQLHWGITSLPSFKEAPGKKYAPDIALLMITPASKHKQEAFQVISLLTSEEAQIEMGKGGRLSSLKDAKARETFGQSLKSLKGVDVKAIVEYSPSPEPPYSKYSDLAEKQINPALSKALSGTTDINTALREAEELANQDIAAELQGSGGK